MELRAAALRALLPADPGAKADAARAPVEARDLPLDTGAALLHAVAHIEFNAIEALLEEKTSLSAGFRGFAR